VEAGIDRVDTAIGSMSMTYGHSATNSVVSILENVEIMKIFEILKFLTNFRVFVNRR
jgi:pyruvate/oxaloacetate carboxyltransferase